MPEWETKLPAALSNTAGGKDAPPADTDEALVSLSGGGDLNAFETLVVRHQKRMLNIAYRLVGNYDDACEVVQDAFISAYRNIGTFRGEAKFTTWLTTITLNLSRNRLKQMKSLQSRLSYCLDDPVWADACESTMDPPSKEPSVLDRLEKQDIRSRVQGCIKALEQDYREVIVLRDMQGFSYDEIGNMLSLQGGTVKSRLFRAREAVKDCLKKVMREL